jgi:hypothetical protein
VIVCDTCGARIGGHRMFSTAWASPAGFSGLYPENAREARDLGFVLATRCIRCTPEPLPTSDEIFTARRHRWRTNQETN